MRGSPGKETREARRSIARPPLGPWLQKSKQGSREPSRTWRKTQHTRRVIQRLVEAPRAPRCSVCISLPAYMLQTKMPKCNHECTTLQRACLVHLRACDIRYCAERAEWRRRVALPGQPWLSVKVSSMWNKCYRILSVPVSSHVCSVRSRHRVHSSGGRRRRATGTRHIWVIVMLLFPLRRFKEIPFGDRRGTVRRTKAGYTCASVCKKSRVVLWREM